MSSFQSFVRRLSVLATACSVLVFAAPASAAVVALFDPAYGPSIPNLGFSGSMTLDVSPSCYAQGPGYVFTGSNCQITALSAQVNFYNASTNPSNILTSVALDASYFDPTSYVVGAYFDPTTGQFAGFDSEDSVQFAVSVSDPDATYPIAYDGTMVLYFVSNEEPIIIESFSDVGPEDAQPGFGGAYLRQCAPDTQGCFGDPSNPASLTFTTVPEPDSFALALLGLGALIVHRRRKSIGR